MHLLAPVIPLLLPYLDTLHLQLALLLPRGKPHVSAVPEVLLGCDTIVDPRFATRAVVEPSVGAADGHVQYEMEILKIHFR